MRLGGVTNLISSRRILGRTATAGDSPVGERDKTPGGLRKYHGAGENLRASGGNTLQGSILLVQDIEPVP